MTSLSNFPYHEIATYRTNDFPGAPTIVFLHDSLGCIELWRDFPIALGRELKCNVLIYDRQGYGKSIPFTNKERDNNYLEVEAGILKNLLEFWRIDKAYLFGHSDGGSIALIAAAKYPGKILGVITEGAHVFVEEITLGGINAAAEAYHATNLKQKLEKYHGEKTDAMFHAWTNTWTSSEFRSWNIEHFLPMIKCPLLVIQGENDEFGSEHQVDAIVNQTSGRAVKCIIPASGHTPHKELPLTVIEKTKDFLASFQAGFGN